MSRVHLAERKLVIQIDHYQQVLAFPTPAFGHARKL
jgi:hypothetical protein